MLWKIPYKYQSLCDQMVREQIELRGVKDEGSLKALREVPRHRFVPEQISHMGIRLPSFSYRRWSDDITTLHSCADDGVVRTKGG